MRDTRTIHYYVPLDPKEQRSASLTLPRDLTQDEADRLSRFLQALVTDG